MKLALVAGLLLRKLWAYPTTIVVLGLFILYQVYCYTHSHGAGLLLLSSTGVRSANHGSNARSTVRAISGAAPVVHSQVIVTRRQFQELTRCSLPLSGERL